MQNNTHSEELPKAFEPKNVEAKWYSHWVESGFFRANPNSSKPPYCIVMPPPNVTGVLHMGHALVNTLQDILIRWHRMCGDEALWVPGTDHAGISTQTVVERHLMKTLGKRRKDFTREEFLEHAWKWKEENANKIIQQLKSLGCSCDWSRERFTMDEGNNRAVKVMFKKMFDQGLIYRGDYLVNWDPVTQTAIADDEVEYEERQSFLWHFKYPFKDGSGFAHIATTRPETMLGDTAVAVSPRDPRYANCIGKSVILPLMNREIPIIADVSVDPEFGTGMVKVTPAHDPCDYQMGLNHKLPFINIMTPDALINENGGPFAGLTMEEARMRVVEEMNALGLLEKVVPHLNRVGVSYRSKAVIEPYMSKQWFVRMSAFGDRLRAAVQEGRFSLIPKNWESTYFHWIDNLRDWCISRQLWWGHRIPIWYHVDDPERMICYDGEGEPPEAESGKWRQDEDSLDTWFSSGLWPFSTLGWPDETPELKRFYPNSVLVTGHDILFFWVARMLFMGEFA
ncbi:MAG: valine--tRNA ligase, partial [Parachlamydia sp.]|nr:valine--tRNA ligase [Parachlamydia sp.]